MLTFDLKQMSRIAKYMKTGLDQPLILDRSTHLNKNLSLTLVLHVYYYKVLATLNLQTLDLKTSRYQVHCSGVNKICKYSYAKVLIIMNKKLLHFL